MKTTSSKFGADLSVENDFLTWRDEAVRLQLAMVLFMSGDKNLQEKLDVRPRWGESSGQTRITSEIRGEALLHCISPLD